MTHGFAPTDFGLAIDQQIELWNELIQTQDTRGDEAYTGHEPPLIVPDETVGSHEYDERKAERERREEVERPAYVKDVAAKNKVAADTLPSESLGSQDALWNDLRNRGHGIYRGMRSVMKREGVYIFGTPQLVMFDTEQPQRVIRLRGTKYVDRREPYPSQRVGPWLTCRIFHRGQFDVSDLTYSVIRYDRRTHNDQQKLKMLGAIQHKTSGGTFHADIDLEAALTGYDDLQVNTYEYDPTEFSDRLRRSIAIVKGEATPEGNATLS